MSTPGHSFRARDNAFIGTSSSVQGEEGLTLASNAALALDNEPYIARLNAGHPDSYQQYLLPPTAGSSGVYPGVLNATYAGVQWFARLDAPITVGTGDNYARVWFSDYRNMESVDMSTQDGDYFPVPSTGGQNLPIRGIASCS